MNAFATVDRKNFADLALCVTLGERTHLIWLEREEVMARRLKTLLERGATVEALIETCALGVRAWATALEGVPMQRAEVLLKNFYEAMAAGQAMDA